LHDHTPGCRKTGDVINMTISFIAGRPRLSQMIFATPDIFAEGTRFLPTQIRITVWIEQTLFGCQRVPSPST
jgi:hypothetical protein